MLPLMSPVLSLDHAHARPAYDKHTWVSMMAQISSGSQKGPGNDLRSHMEDVVGLVCMLPELPQGLHITAPPLSCWQAQQGADACCMLDPCSSLPAICACAAAALALHDWLKALMPQAFSLEPVRPTKQPSFFQLLSLAWLALLGFACCHSEQVSDSWHPLQAL